MTKIKDPLGGTKLKIDRVFINSRNQQMTIVLPRKKMKGVVPSKIVITYWK